MDGRKVVLVLGEEALPAGGRVRWVVRAWRTERREGPGVDVTFQEEHQDPRYGGWSSSFWIGQGPPRVEAAEVGGFHADLRFYPSRRVTGALLDSGAREGATMAAGLVSARRAALGLIEGTPATARAVRA